MNSMRKYSPTTICDEDPLCGVRCVCVKRVCPGHAEVASRLPLGADTSKPSHDRGAC